MAKAPTTTYGNDSISMLKGAERVRCLGGYDSVAECGELFWRGESEVGIGHPSVR